MPRYFKGHDINSDHLAIFKVYDEQVNCKFGLVKSYIVEVQHIDHCGIDHYETLEDCLKEYVMKREIFEDEYKFYESMQALITEFYENQIIGGFPRESTVSMISRKIHREAPRLCDRLLNDPDNNEILKMSKWLYEALEEITNREEE